MTPKISPAAQTRDWRSTMLLAGLLALLLGTLFFRSFDPGLVAFSNDGPLGAQSTGYSKLPAGLSGMWDDLNDTGFQAGVYVPSVTGTLFWLLGPLWFSKIYVPIALFILGLGAGTFFRALRFSPLAAMLGALAAMLNSAFFAAACWGVASQQIALGMDFLALALIVANRPETPGRIRWLRLALAGLCVGINVMEAADIGAIYSLAISAFVLVKSLTDAGKPVLTRAVHGLGRVAVVALFAGFIAFQTVVSLVGTEIHGIAGTAQDTETKAQHWDWATQWSLPKKETLELVVPGLFGYRMDTPTDMIPQFQDAYRGGAYWGGLGRSPELDRYIDAGSRASCVSPAAFSTAAFW